MPRFDDFTQYTIIRAALQAGMSGAVFGLIVGGAQWLARGRLLPSGGRWIIASGLGWMVGMALGAALAEMITVLGALLVAGVTNGAITGFVVQRLNVVSTLEKQKA